MEERNEERCHDPSLLEHAHNLNGHGMYGVAVARALSSEVTFFDEQRGSDPLGILQIGLPVQ